MTENFKGLPNFVKQELEKLKPYEGKELQFPLGDNAFNFWELDAKSVFPHTPELQKTFNKLKKKNLKKQRKKQDL